MNMKITIRTVGNSRGIIIPRNILAHIGLENHAEMSVEDGAIVLRKPIAPPRSGWSESARLIATEGDDALVLDEFSNQDDRDLKW